MGALSACIRIGAAALAVALACGVANAQQSGWNDPTPRLSFDLADTGWVSAGRDNPTGRVILNLGPDGFDLKGAAITRICMLDYLHQPVDRVVSQAEANAALQASAEDQRRKPGAPAETMFTHDGVDMREAVNVEPNPATGAPMNRIRWNFVLSADRAMNFMGLVCVADQSLGDAAVAELRGIMRRMRIAGEGRS